MSGGWSELAEPLTALEAELRAQAPDEATAREVRPYLARLITSALHDGFLAHEDTAHGLKRAWPRIGGPFLDYRMWQAQVEPGRDYLLTAELEDVERLGVGAYSVTQAGVLLLEDYVVITQGPARLSIGPSGQLRTTPATRMVMLRELLRPPGVRPALLRLTFADGAPLPPPATHLDLGQAAARVAALARQFARWSALMAEAPNTITVPPQELAAAYVGDSGTHYYPGYFELAADELLVVERPPVACYTWSLSAYTHWLEPLPPPFQESGRTHDRRLGLRPEAPATIRLGPKGDGAAIVTGRRRGALIYRTVGAEVLAVPRVWTERR